MKGLFKISGVEIAGITTTVPPVSDTIFIDSIGQVKYRKSSFEQTTSDLGFNAAERLLQAKYVNKEEIGVLIFLSRTPDYRSPNTAAILQGRLGLEIDCICYDVNCGSNGFALGIQLASSMLQNINKEFALLIIGDTVSKLNNSNLKFAAIESDAATAVLLKKEAKAPLIKSYCNVYTENFEKLAILKGGFRYFAEQKKFESTDANNFLIDFDTDFIGHFLKENLESFIAMALTITGNNLKSSKTLLHSNLALFIESVQNDENKKEIQAILSEYGNLYASSIPLQLSSYFQNIPEDFITQKFNAVTFGEGLILNCLSFDLAKDNIVAVQEHEGIFEDYRVSHDV